MGEILTEFVGLLIGGISELGTGIGTGLNNAVTAMFLESAEGVTSLSTFGGMVAIFG
jgi:hypothetical protein